jgi:hypothetical protein
LMARPASTPPGCASNSACQATSATERLDSRLAPERRARRYSQHSPFARSSSPG